MLPLARYQSSFEDYLGVWIFQLDSSRKKFRHCHCSSSNWGPKTRASSPLYSREFWHADNQKSSLTTLLLSGSSLFFSQSWLYQLHGCLWKFYGEVVDIFLAIRYTLFIFSYAHQPLNLNISDYLNRLLRKIGLRASTSVDKIQAFR